MVSFFAAIENRGTPPQMYIYQGGVAVATGSTFSVAETTADDSKNQNPRIAQFGPTKTLYAFVGDGVYKTENGGGNWSLVFSPSALTANSAYKFGPLVITIDGKPYLCIAWRSGSTVYRMARSSDGINWEESKDVRSVRDGGATNVTVHKSMIYTSNPFSDVQDGGIRWFDFKNMGGGGFPNLFNTNPRPNTPVVHNDRAFYVSYRGGTGPLRIELRELLGGTFANLLATFDTGTAMDVGAGGAAWSSNNRIYYASRGNSGIRMFRTNVALTSFEEITLTAVPTTLQNDTDANVIRIITHPTKIDGSEKLAYVRNVGDTWDIYRWREDLEELQLIYAGVGSVEHSLPVIDSFQGTHFYNPALARVEIVETIDRLDGLEILFKLYGENGAVQSSNVAFTHATNPGDNSIPNPCTLIDPSAGSISGNQVRNLNTDNGVTTYSVKWDLTSDGFSNEDRYKLITSISINRPLRRRKKRKKWYKF